MCRLFHDFLSKHHFPDWHFGQHCKIKLCQKKLVTTMIIKREGLGKSTALIFADFRRLSVAGQVRAAQARLGLVRSGYVRLHQVSLGLVRFGQVRLGQARLGLVRLRYVRLRQVTLGFIRFRQVSLGFVKLGVRLGDINVTFCVK